jgi:hypothetical protein
MCCVSCLARNTTVHQGTWRDMQRRSTCAVNARFVQKQSMSTFYKIYMDLIIWKYITGIAKIVNTFTTVTSFSLHVLYTLLWCVLHENNWFSDYSFADYVYFLDHINIWLSHLSYVHVLLFMLRNLGNATHWALNIIICCIVCCNCIYFLLPTFILFVITFHS